MTEEYKEVSFDVAAADTMSGGTRRRRGRGRKTMKQQGGADEGSDVGIQKAEVAPAPAPAPVVKELAPIQSGGAAPVVVIAPAKKKPAKLMLVPKGKAGKPALKKTFKAKRVCVTIDNTAKTRKHHQSLLQKVDSMSVDQLRAAAVASRLSRRESVAKVPEKLLRQMVRDYQTMKGMLL
jgi:hypothetical protein